MSKNIILCADGTGNKGGYTPDSNIYKLYNAVDLHDPDRKQIAFYDNGVGTETNKYIRSLTGALGFGFKRNVCDLYEFLARNYEPGDDIYMFGFSRGAATVRAFNGFIYACGLIDGRGKGNKELKCEVEIAMEAYSKEGTEKAHLLSNISFHPEPPEIKVIGVWDTVSALGFPERTDITGIFLFALNYAFVALGNIADKFFPNKFYNYELTPNVINAYQALAIDDERTSFWPMVWRENSPEAKDVNIEQTWFAGMHSNIGGGYERAGLANVNFAWMLEKLKDLKLKSGVLLSAKEDANVHGRLYDSRQGFAVYYRYHPRDIKTLCDDAGAKIKVHESVIRRLRLRTANYAPTALPKHFEIVDNQGNSIPSPMLHQDDWSLFRAGISYWQNIRKWLYGALLELTLVVLGITWYRWIYPPTPEKTPPAWLAENIADILRYFTPTFFDGFIERYIVQKPLYAICGAGLIAGYFYFRKYALRRTFYYAERLRKLFIIAPKGYPVSGGGDTLSDTTED
ncbi:MAG: DUF2235 domain-containing protein [Desulfobulbaceae bacterium]|nr:DUF2235 domain-containing protein [Desulfobulbaceae bacterium]